MTADRVATCLWYDQDAEDAVNFYVSVFENARITSLSRYVKGMHMPEGLALVIEFEINGQHYMALNGGPHFKLSEAVSIAVTCDTQAEIDDLWERLSAGGSKSQCGWLKDRFGLSWQLFPSAVKTMITSGEPKRIEAMFAALMQMQKIDIAKLRAAYDAA